MRTAYGDLIELDKMKSEFIQNVNHELRTPLAVIVGAVECLLDPPDPSPKRQELLLGVMAQAEKLSAMVQSLLELGALSDEDGARPSEVVDLGSWLECYVTERPHLPTLLPRGRFGNARGRRTGDRPRPYQAVAGHDGGQSTSRIPRAVEPSSRSVSWFPERDPRRRLRWTAA